MTKEEVDRAMKVVGSMSKVEAYSFLKDYITLVARFTNPEVHMNELLSALHKLKPSQPDPITGLVPCGCGERVMVSQYPQTLIRAVQYRISCFNCGVETRMFLSKQEAVNAWNSAMGCKKEAADE